MICNLCGVHDATIHLTEIQNQQMVEIHLCETCAQEKGTEFKTHFNFNDLLSGFPDPSTWLTAQSLPTEKEKCGGCGMTLEELSKNGRLGCSDCYKAFEETLKVLIRRVQRSVQHVGKTPQSGVATIVPRPKSERVGVETDLQLLQQKLRQSVQSEAFEEAAKLRDQIKKLEEKNRKSKSSPKKL